MASVLLAQQAAISADVLSQEVSGETVLLDLKNEAYFGLDETGTRIWQLIQENGNLQVAFDTMLAEFDVEPDVLHKDFSEFLTRLTEAGLVSLKPAD